MKSPNDISIRALIEAQFEALRWEEGGEADWPTFENGFLIEAQVAPAARPAKLQPVSTFVARMQKLAALGELRSFSECPLAIQINRYGNIAVALAGCEITENGDTVTRDVSAFLLVLSEGSWRIAAQAWDAETPPNPLRLDLLMPRD